MKLALLFFFFSTSTFASENIVYLGKASLGSSLEGRSAYVWVHSCKAKMKFKGISLNITQKANLERMAIGTGENKYKELFSPGNSRELTHSKFFTFGKQSECIEEIYLEGYAPWGTEVEFFGILEAPAAVKPPIGVRPLR